MQAFARPLLHGASRLALACALAPLAFVALDLGYRAQLHRPLLAHDDWRSARIERLMFGSRAQFDPLLGWAPREDYQSEDYNTLDLGIRLNFGEDGIRTGGVLAVGDVFTEGGIEAADGETWPAHLERMTGEPAINAGVAGYAADQIVLRAEQLLPRVRPRTLVVALFEETIARAGQSFFGSSKPYFTMDNGQLAYHAPHRAEPDALAGWQAGVRDVLGRSAVLDAVLSRLAPAYFLQTPNVGFPIEAHFSLPFIHWLPEQMRAAILRAPKGKYVPKDAPYDAAIEMVQRVVLLSGGQVRELFPDAEVRAERVLGLAKSWIAVREGAAD